jgi:hypothetical protein
MEYKDYNTYVKHPWHCGPGNWPHWLKYLLGLFGRNKFCAFHDHRYNKPVGAKTDEDWAFFRAQFDSHGSFLRGLIDFIYFFAVYKYGRKSWENNRLKD